RRVTVTVRIAALMPCARNPHIAARRGRSPRSQPSRETRLGRRNDTTKVLVSKGLPRHRPGNEANGSVGSVHFDQLSSTRVHRAVARSPRTFQRAQRCREHSSRQLLTRITSATALLLGRRLELAGFFGEFLDGPAVGLLDRLRALPRLRALHLAA